MSAGPNSVFPRQEAAPDSLQDRDAQHARDMQEASKCAAQDLEVKAMQLRSQLEQSQQALHVEKAQYGQQETLVHTQKQLDKLQLDLASERQKIKQLTGKSQEVAQAKQNALDASKALQVILDPPGICLQCRTLLHVVLLRSEILFHSFAITSDK